MAIFDTAAVATGSPVAGSASWAQVSATSTATLAAAAADEIQVTVSAVMAKGRGRILLDVASIVSDAIVARAGGTLGSFQMDPTSDDDFASRAQGDRLVTFTTILTVAAPDISGGNVALSPVVKGSGRVKIASGLRITALNLTKLDSRLPA